MTSVTAAEYHKYFKLMFGKRDQVQLSTEFIYGEEHEFSYQSVFCPNRQIFCILGAYIFPKDVFVKYLLITYDEHLESQATFFHQMEFKFSDNSSMYFGNPAGTSDPALYA